MGCKTSGDNTTDSNSLAAVTARNGVRVVVGFNDDFNIPSGKPWSKRNNDHLAAGYGVSDSLLEANNHIYLNPNVKSGVIWHHGDSNMTITLNNQAQANLKDNVNISDNKNILPVEKQNILDSDIDNIVTNITNYYPNFDIKNYEVVNTTTSIVNVETGETTEIEYTDFMLKVGDFITTAGFTVRCEDNKLVKIIDNNIDVEKQEKEKVIKLNSAQNIEIESRKESLGIEIEHLTTYGLRHSFSTLYFTLGMPQEVLHVIMGYADFDTTRRFYIHITGERKMK